jgi:ATP-dependent DNA helicase RecG
MNSSLDQLHEWMNAKEDEHLEFKEAKSNFHFGKLVKYCAALGNEGGGRMILGVTDTRPRRVVGSTAFSNLERTKAGIIERLRLRIDGEEMQTADGRVVVFHVPPRPIGMPIPVDGAYWMRGGEELVPMTPDMLQRIFAEAGPDFSAETCPKVRLDDLIPEAIEDFRRRWMRKSGNAALAELSTARLLEDAELIVDGRVTYAALVLFGTRAALGKHLAQAEVIFEYRSTEAAGPAQQREEYRHGFFSFYDELWAKINLRNDKQHYQDGLFMVDVPTFDEVAVREAILNAVSHRDYRDGKSVFIKQFPRRIEIISPGGFPPGVSAENILDRQFPRNRRLAEAFGKSGLVERSGQGANRIYEACIREGKPLPTFGGTDERQVALTLDGQVQDARFLHFLEKVGRARLASFTTHDLLVLNLVYWSQPLPEDCRSRVPALLEEGILERSGRGKYILSRQFHAFIGKKGVYTRKKGLDRETNKQLLVKHIKENAIEGSKMEDLRQVLPGHSRNQIQVLLRELRKAGAIISVGRTRAGRWYPAVGRADCNQAGGETP